MTVHASESDEGVYEKDQHGRVLIGITQPITQLSLLLFLFERHSSLACFRRAVKALQLPSHSQLHFYIFFLRQRPGGYT
jgi:hypothetical protein